MPAAALIRRLLLALVTSLILCRGGGADERPTRDEAARALRRAVAFFADEVSPNGAFVWRYSGDLTLREGEGRATESMGWVQPPGMPTVGEAFLDAYDATGERASLEAARNVADALIRSQMRSGGWDHHIELDPEKRQAYGYRDVPRRKRQEKKTSLDDDITQSAVRFLMRLDKTLRFREERVHEAARYALDGILRAQHPNGGWYMWWERYPEPARAEKFPVRKASYPDSWSRVWLNDWTGRYYLNDNLAVNTLLTLLAAHETYGDERYLAAARKAGDFLLLAQMPEPQPAWAQQYDVHMHPVWDRKFEPPAISGHESQRVMEGLMALYRATGDRQYLEPIPRAVAYLRTSLLPDGRLARFYELQTNRPLYFQRTGQRYDLTYSDADVPDHYGFQFASRLDGIEADYRRLLAADPHSLNTDREAPAHVTPDLERRVRAVIAALDDRGAWVERGRMEHVKQEPPSGIISSHTFAENVRTLSRYLAASVQPER